MVEPRGVQGRSGGLAHQRGPSDGAPYRRVVVAPTGGGGRHDWSPDRPGWTQGYPSLVHFLGPVALAGLGAFLLWVTAKGPRWNPGSPPLRAVSRVLGAFMVNALS